MIFTNKCSVIFVVIVIFLMVACTLLARYRDIPTIIITYKTSNCDIFTTRKFMYVCILAIYTTTRATQPDHEHVDERPHQSCTIMSY